MLFRSLRREREREIRQLAGHATQMQNELAAYQHAAAPVGEMMRKHTGYVESPAYNRILKDIAAFLDGEKERPDAGTAAAPPEE